MKLPRLFVGLGLMAFAGSLWANCPPATVADMKGVPSGKYPQQYDLAEFEKLAGCKMSFKEPRPELQPGSSDRADGADFPDPGAVLPDLDREGPEHS